MIDPDAAADPQTLEDQAALVRFVQTHEASCPVCEYSLRGLRSAVCPECAAHLHLQVGSENLHAGPWFLGVVSFALGLGFDGVVTLMICAGSTIALIQFGRPTPADIWGVARLLLVFLPLVAGCATGLTLMFRRRVAWRRMSARRQWKMAVAIFVGTGLVHATAGALLFKIMS